MDKISKKDIINAINEIDSNPELRKGRASSTYDLLYNNIEYPPKLVISIANKIATGEQLNPNDFEGGIGTPAFKLLEGFDFEIQKKRDPIKLLIEDYKKHIEATQLCGEVYKWELINEFKGRPNTDAVDFYQEVKSIKFKNLVYAMGIAVLNDLTEVKPEEMRVLFKNLFNENIVLSDRIISFNVDSLKIYRDLGRTLQHHQDERSIATYLTYHNNEKYTLYKSSFYKKYCQLLGVKEAKKNEKYVHYLQLINELIENYIKQDAELISQVKNLIPEYYDGKNHNLLAQDILYQMLEKEKEINYWIFQGNPKVFDFETALKEDILTDWTVSAHKDKIKIGDKVILWIGGANAGCYALAEIASEPHLKVTSPDDHLWKGEDKSDLKADIKITHNLVQNPILKTKIDSIDILKNLKVGSQGTNFSATKDEFDAMIKLIENQETVQYWIYAPGENADLWEEFYEKGIMALGWDELGDLSNYKSKNEIKERLQQLENTNSSKQNDTTANFDFYHAVKPRDIIIVKKGRTELMGYGEVVSDYYYDNQRDYFKSCRKVNWKVKGNWKVDHSLVLKTFTNITSYPTKNPDYKMYYEYLLGIMGNINNKEAFIIWLSNKFQKESGTKNSYLRAIDLLSEKIGYSIFEESNIAKLNLLYDDLIKRQSEESGKYWNEKAPSYGLQGFYSASIKKYTEFLKEYLSKKTNMKTSKTNSPLNQILYGPPGTGKTYRLQKEYFDKFTIKETALSRDQYLESLIGELSWWQTISIAVLDLGSAKVNEIHDHEFIRIKEKLSASKTIRPTIWGQLQSHTVLDCPNVNVAARMEPLFFYKSTETKWTVDNELLEQYYPEAFEILEKSKNFVPDTNKSIKNYEFITFHQSFSYEDFIEGIKPKLDDSEKDVSFEIKDGVFKKLCLKAEADPTNDYAIFIDEINRGNVSAIFGELITLIENDKRIGGANEIKVRLPYSKSEFGVPSNLFIIGTMNTADRSVEALDTALRRRFSFTEIMPDSTLLDKIEFNGFTLAEVLGTINERIEVLLDRDHTIGHSYFLKLESGDVEGLKSVFTNNIIPLLQEYFYHDYEKIALILGEGFIKIKENKTVKFANFKNIDSPEIANQFELISSIDDIENAIILLLNN